MDDPHDSWPVGYLPRRWSDPSWSMTYGDWTINAFCRLHELRMDAIIDADVK